MANTFKFGNGNWAVKDGQVLAYNDENNNFKPLPFEFTRASTATRLNRQGLVEVVPSGKPRIDFLDNTKGHLLLEPSRTNQFTYSESLNSGWVTGGATMTLTASQFVSPDGSQNASRLQIPSSGSASLFYQFESHSSGTQYTISMYAKSNTGTNQSFRLYGDYGASGNISSDFTATNEWQRFTYTFTASASGSRSTGIYNTLNEAADLQIYGIQFEQGSYATSYIPTEGSSVTRVVDDISLTLPTVDSFSSSSGFSVIAKFDIGATSGSSSVPFLFFNDDSGSTYIGFGSNTTNLRCRLNLSGTSYLNTQANAPRTQRNSLFTSCDSSGWSQGANGLTNHTGTNNASIFNRLASITFITSETYGIIKISELLVYNTRLSNTELQNLTS